MKKFYFLSLAILSFIDLNGQNINFNDALLKAKLLSASSSNNVAKNLLWQNTKIDLNDNGEIDTAEAANIVALNFSNSNVASVDGLSNFINLKTLDCHGNAMAVLDISPLHFLDTLFADNNVNLTYLNLKNGRIAFNVPPPPPAPPGVGGAMLAGCVNLQYICADDAQIDQGMLFLDYYYSQSTVNLNSYCSFTPGGTFYTIQGNAAYDNNNDGCDANDSSLPNLGFALSDGTVNTNVIGNATGNFSIYVPEGKHTITPVLENPDYFNVSPVGVTVDFPSQGSLVNQNFCIVANGVHSDLEITILPLNGARPGFDANYKIVYKNKGTSAQSGNITFGFNDAVLDFIFATPPISAQALNYRTWNFIDLQAFETRTVLVTLNLNSAAETPSVNSGFILNYTLSINSSITDETPNDNTFVMNQTVVNSFDPNNKTCLEGKTITPEMIGDYVRYIIRFKNTGTANAQNIVVKDVIDIAKFEIGSLIPLIGSHEFVTKISEINKVSFIFKNINLPFDDANNDGYIAFKIKTLATLTTEDTFSNTASIYFNYNLPVMTNESTTTIAALSKPDFAFKNYFGVYPNPVKESLNIVSNRPITVTSIQIYNSLGQLVMVVPNTQQMLSLNVSHLKSGNYYIKISSDSGSSSGRFLKQ